MYEIDGSFLEEALELLDECEEALLAGERDAEQVSESLRVLYRCFHSLKGASSMFALKEHEEVFHELEGLLPKNGVLEDINLFSYLIDNMDHLRKLFVTGENNIRPYVDAATKKNITNGDRKV